MSNRQRKCSKCQIELVNSTGVHMGIPFGHWTTRDGFAPSTQIIVCGKCYDEITIGVWVGWLDSIHCCGNQEDCDCPYNENN